MKKTTNLLAFLAAFLFCVSGLWAQETFPRNGVADHRDGLYAFTNATIYKSPTERLEDATLVIREGKVEAVGQGIPVPPDAVIVDCSGKTIYPAFIDMYAEYGMPETKRERRGGGFGRPAPQPLSDKPGAYAWNEALKPEFRGYEHFTTDDKAAADWRKTGFGAVLSHKMDGISRGTSTLVALGDGREHEMILEEEVAHHLSFRKGSSSQNYPSSLMGAIALLKQTWLDAAWYKEYGYKEETNISLENWNRVQSLKQIFEVGDKLEALRAAKIGETVGVRFIIKGAGDEYQRLEDIQKTQSAFIIPVNFPDAYDVEDPYDASLVTLSQMKHWELAPTNPARLERAGVRFAFTTAGLSKKSDFLPNIRKAIEQGLPEEAALRALTTTPAELMGVANRLGTLDAGKIANFIITNGNIFDKKTKIYHNWIQGKPFVFKTLDRPDLAGFYALTVGDSGYRLRVKDKGDDYSMKLEMDDSSTIEVKNKVENNRITMSFKPAGKRGLIRLTGTIDNGKWSGRGQDETGQWVKWNAVPRRPPEMPADEDDEQNSDGKNSEQAQRVGPVVYPFMAYGWTTRPEQKTWLLKNATVWTNEPEGILEGADVLIENGKIARVGKNLSARGAIEIDATGKHITPGIIDEHTHVGVSRGVNEGTQASSAEVSIGDVINSDDINIYRQLAGGVTAAQILHGSANPIGGQSGLVKFRWGYSPEEMKIENADGFIKFALGENVKQSNWGDNNRTRFPQTRMGVEQVYEDYFTRAEEYGRLKRSGKPYRKDLEMETLLEILEGKRFITCHSYVQSEINMLMKVAERHGFRINTFTHILEGYKVADIMAKHGAGGSTFSDWWAYKFEVYNAIPYNGAMMHEQGVTVAYNSDDAEMARRLNQEAAKAVLFGGVSEEDALKFVTLNPAKLLHLDDRMGSLKPGKDADVVVWSDHPLSIYAKAEMTFVDGIKFFDRAEDAKMHEDIQKERNRLIQKMLAVKKNGGKTQRPFGRRGPHYHCDDMEDEMH
ncbi:MAG: amidohydrolase [Bacteroidetes bacterium]|nr:MAG: amidohydrolase [Bacteroidota bacterium]